MQINRYFLFSLLWDVCGDVCTLTFQSDSHAILKLSGPNVRKTVSQLVLVDLHPRVFRQRSYRLHANPAYSGHYVADR